MTTQTHQPWKPTCWVGGMMVVRRDSCDICMLLGKPGVCIASSHWIACGSQELQDIDDDCRSKYAATKATAAILRSMRK